MTRLFFLFSGEHSTLPEAEIKAVLEAENVTYENPKTSSQVLCLDADEEAVRAVSSRSGLTKICGRQIFACEADQDEILRMSGDAPYEEILAEKQTFAVEVKRMQRSAPWISANELKTRIGSMISERSGGAKVNLGAPVKVFLGVITDQSFIFGLKLAETSYQSFKERRPKNKPFFHPSALHPKLARCMVNLARAASGSLVLDPFCGTGSILIEAGLIGCRVLGADVSRLMVNGSLMNLRRFNIKPLALIVADAVRLPFDEVDFVVTDPPYGRRATTLGLPVKDLICQFLSSLDVLPRGGYVSIASPEGVEVSELGRSVGFDVVERHSVYVHKSLTRELAVLKKT